MYAIRSYYARRRFGAAAGPGEGRLDEQFHHRPRLRQTLTEGFDAVANDKRVV